MRAPEHAPRDPRRVLEDLHGLTEIVERGVGVHEIKDSCAYITGKKK